MKPPPPTMKFIFVAGVEGSGHYLLRSLLADVFHCPSFVVRGDYHPLFERRWNEPRSQLPISTERRVMERILSEYEKEGATHFFEDMSVPFGLERDPLLKPDFLDVARLLHGLVEIRWIALYRDPVSSTYSCLRRGFSTNPAREARMTEAGHLHISSQLSQLPVDCWRVLEFDRLLEEPAIHIAAIAEWMELEEDGFRQAVQRIRIPSIRSNIPRRVLRELEEFFHPARRQQWEGFYGRNPLVPSKHSRKNANHE